MTPTKTQAIKAMAAHGIAGEVTGAGRNWDVKFPNGNEMDKFNKHVCQVGGHANQCGEWRCCPEYIADTTDPNSPYSPMHY